MFSNNPNEFSFGQLLKETFINRPIWSHWRQKRIFNIGLSHVGQRRLSRVRRKRRRPRTPPQGRAEKSHRQAFARLRRSSWRRRRYLWPIVKPSSSTSTNWSTIVLRFTRVWSTSKINSKSSSRWLLIWWRNFRCPDQTKALTLMSDCAEVSVNFNKRWFILTFT